MSIRNLSIVALIAGASIGALVLSPIVASAQETSSTGMPPPQIGSQHTCDQWYPSNLQRQGIEGITTLAFYITAKGHTRHITVQESSGNNALDFAARLCASGWFYQPMIQDGKPVETPWVAKVVWKVPAPEPATSMPTAPASASPNAGSGHKSLFRVVR